MLEEDKAFLERKTEELNDTLQKFKKKQNIDYREMVNRVKDKESEIDVLKEMIRSNKL